MGTLITIVLGAAVIGYAAYILKGIVKKTKVGECSGCGHCPDSHQCSGKH